MNVTECTLRPNNSSDVPLQYSSQDTFWNQCRDTASRIANIGKKILVFSLITQLATYIALEHSRTQQVGI